MKPTSMLIILLFAFTLAACGGGGGSSSVPDVPVTPDPEMPMEPTADEQAAADAAVMAANDAATAANAAAMAAMDAVSAATLADTMAASDAAQAATNAAQAATDAAAAVVAGDEATVTAATDAADAADAAAMTANMAASYLIAAEEDAVAEAAAEAARMAAEQARIMALTMAIADPDGDGKFPEDNELTHRRPGETITFASGGATTVGSDELNKNNVNIKNANEFQPKSGSSIGLMDFDASMHERTTVKGVTDTLTIYSNVEAPGNEAYNTYYASATATDRTGVTSVTNATQPEGGARTLYNTVEFTNAEINSVLKYMKGAGIPSSPGLNRPTAAGADNAFSGTFHGIPGTYTCTTACDFDTDADNVATLVGTLTFQPSPTNNDTQDAHVVEGIYPDTDYLSFGYWTQTTPMGSGTKYGVGVFSGGSMPYGGADVSAEINQLQGTATYDGSATGLYARKELAVEDGRVVVGTPVAAGQYSADVSMTAYFGNTALTTTDPASTALNTVINGVADNETFSISGTVDNFQDMNGAMIDGSWAVNLNKADFEAAGTATNTFNGTTGSGEMEGMWTGGFFGDHDHANNPDTDTRPPEVQTATKYPTGVAGEFTGHFTNGHVIGAFGATGE